MYRSVVVLVVIAAALAGVPATVQAASSTISVAVPLTQLLEGTTVITLAPGTAAQQGQLLVKSNVSWQLVARTADGAVVIWNGASGRQELEGQTVVLQGNRGVHTVTFEVQRRTQDAAGSAVQVTFSIEPTR